MKYINTHISTSTFSAVVLLVLINLLELEGTYVDPQTFLESRLSKGTWIARKDVTGKSRLFEGGYVWTSSGDLQVTHVCRGKSSPIKPRGIGPIEPGQLVNGTCYVSSYPRMGGTPGGIKQFV